MSEVGYSFVVDADAALGYQSYLLVRSLVDLADVSPSRITAHVVNGTDASVERALQALGVTTRWVEPFGHPYCNKIQQLARRSDPWPQTLVLLDTDMFALAPLALPDGKAVLGKMVDYPLPPIDVLTRIFAQAGVSLERAQSDVVAAPTARGNFNGGLYVLPGPLIDAIAEAWARWAQWSLERTALFAEWGRHIDQVSFALAAAELNVPIQSLPRRYNTPTHLGPQPADDEPALLHYHRHVDTQLLLRPTGQHIVDRAIDRANAAILGWRQGSDLSNSLFWRARHGLYPDLGSATDSAASHSPESHTPAALPGATTDRGSGRLSLRGTTRMNPSVTVVVPAYRPADPLRQTLESLAQQTFRDFLVRVSVDWTPDDPTPAVPRPAGLPLEVVYQRERLGWIGNTNFLLASIDTPYFLMMGHDDTLSPTYLEEAMLVLKGNSQISGAHGAAHYHGVREGDIITTPSIRGDRLARVLTYLDRGPHVANVLHRGVIRSDMLARGARLRTRQSDGMFSNDLFGLEVIIGGPSEFIEGIYYHKHLLPSGLSREFHARSYIQRSAMMADNLACLVDVLHEAEFSQAEQELLASRWAEWLLGLQGNWNVVSDDRNSDSASYAQVRPALARFVAMAALSASADHPAWPMGPPSAIVANRPAEP